MTGQCVEFLDARALTSWLAPLGLRSRPESTSKCDRFVIGGTESATAPACAHNTASHQPPARGSGRPIRERHLRRWRRVWPRWECSRPSQGTAGCSHGVTWVRRQGTCRTSCDNSATPSRPPGRCRYETGNTCIPTTKAQVTDVTPLLLYIRPPWSRLRRRGPRGPAAIRPCRGCDAGGSL